MSKIKNMNTTAILLDLKVKSINVNKTSMLIENLKLPYKKRLQKGYDLYYYDVLFTKENMAQVKNLLNSKFVEIDSDNIRAINDFKYKSIYSDGGSFNNGQKDINLPMFASYGYILVDGTYEKNTDILYEEVDKHISNFNRCDNDSLRIQYEPIPNGTNNIGELYGVMKSLKYIIDNKSSDEEVNVIISSDSQYVIKGMNEWIHGWRLKNWKNNKNEDIKNKSDWLKLYEYMTDHNLNIFTLWQRGHTNQTDHIARMNYYVDKTCNIAINEYMNEVHPNLVDKHKRKI